MGDAAIDGERPMLLTFTAASRELGLNRKTLWRLIKAGHIHPVEFPSGKRYVSRQELERFIEERTIRD